MGITRTKIICTIGPATKDLAVLRKLYKAGMNVVRINMSHADHVFAKNIIDKAAIPGLISAVDLDDAAAKAVAAI